jgi:hypothetical protein
LYSWQQFLVERSLEGSFDAFAINKKWHVWISLGLMMKKKAAVNTSETNYTCKLTVLRAKPRVIIAHKFIYIITRSV